MVFFPLSWPFHVNQLSSKDSTAWVIADLLPRLFGRRRTAIIQTPCVGCRIIRNVAVLHGVKVIAGQPKLAMLHKDAAPKALDFGFHQQLSVSAQVVHTWEAKLVDRPDLPDLPLVVPSCASKVLMCVRQRGQLPAHSGGWFRSTCRMQWPSWADSFWETSSYDVTVPPLVVVGY